MSDAGEVGHLGAVGAAGEVSPAAGAVGGERATSGSATPTLREGLLRIAVFADLAPQQLDWLAERMIERRLAQGEVSVEEGSPADRMVVVFEGELQGRREKGPSDGWMYLMRAGEVSGMLPFSRMVTFTVTVRAVVPSWVGYLNASLFLEMLRFIPELEPRLVGVLTDRVREATRIDQERDKLIALGKLSAGLAHELNNPAAAVQRGASELAERLPAMRNLAVRLVECGVAPPAMAGAVDLYRGAIERRRSGQFDDDDPLVTSDREEAVAEWLAAHRVERAWELAGTLASYGVEPARLVQLAADAPAAGEYMSCLVAWLEGGLAVESLLADMSHASHRISELVAAVKSYSHMDDGEGRAEVDLRREIESTLTILAHKTRKKNVTIERDFPRDLPRMEVYPGELNQVWTNLLDNAIDAVAPGGHIAIRATREGDAVRVEVTDDGPGIPPEIQARIWEPFFTTKPVGEGTGLGLEIAHRIVVRRHGGVITVDSRPGRTTFNVRLPIRLAPVAPAAPAAPAALAAGATAADSPGQPPS